MVWIFSLSLPLLLVFQENNAAGNINDILYPWQRWKKSSKLVMGLTIWNSHTELISFASRHSKFIFFSNYIPFSNPKGLQSFKTFSFTMGNDSFVNILSSVAKCKRVFFSHFVPEVNLASSIPLFQGNTLLFKLSWQLYCADLGFQKFTIIIPFYKCSPGPKQLTTESVHMRTNVQSTHMHTQRLF